MRDFQNAVAATTNVSVSNVFAADQGGAFLANEGFSYDYYWGMYEVCGGDGVSGARRCGPSSFGHRYEPITVLQASQPAGIDVTQILPQGTFQDNMYLGNFTQAAFYLLFIGTCAAGVAFLVGILSHRFAFLFAALFSLLAAACIAVGAAIWTAIVYKVRDSVNNANLGITAGYGNLIWLSWAAFGASLVAFPFLVVSCCVGRNNY